MINACPCARAFEGGPRTKNCQGMELLNGTIFVVKYRSQKVYHFVCKNGRTQGGNRVFRMWPFFGACGLGLCCLMLQGAWGNGAWGSSFRPLFKALSSLFSGGLGCQTDFLFSGRATHKEMELKKRVHICG